MSVPSSPSNPKALAAAWHSQWLRRIEPRGTMQTIADEMGIDKSRASRIKNEEMPECLELLARSGMRVVPADEKTYPQHVVNAMFVLAKENIASAESLDDIIAPR